MIDGNGNGNTCIFLSTPNCGPASRTNKFTIDIPPVTHRLFISYKESWKDWNDMKWCIGVTRCGCVEMWRCTGKRKQADRHLVEGAWENQRRLIVIIMVMEYNTRHPIPYIIPYTNIAIIILNDEWMMYDVLIVMDRVDLIYLNNNIIHTILWYTCCNIWYHIILISVSRIMYTSWWMMNDEMVIGIGINGYQWLWVWCTWLYQVFWVV